MALTTEEIVENYVDYENSINGNPPVTGGLREIAKVCAGEVVIA